MFSVILLKCFELLLKLYPESHQKLRRTIITSQALNANFFLLVTAGTDESQALEPDSFPENDDDQSGYFADDETSICQSPSTTEFPDEDECIESKCELPLLFAIQ